MPKTRQNTPPADAVCIEQGCDYPATTTRTATEPWLYEGGVIAEYDEWVCAFHSWTNIGYTTDGGVVFNRRIDDDA